MTSISPSMLAGALAAQDPERANNAQGWTTLDSESESEARASESAVYADSSSTTDSLALMTERPLPPLPPDPVIPIVPQRATTRPRVGRRGRANHAQDGDPFSSLEDAVAALFPSRI